MKIICSFLLLLLTQQAAFAGAGDGMGNGSGLSEIRLIDTWSQSTNIFKKILTNYKSELSLEEVAFVESLLLNQVKEVENLTFKSGKLEPDLFKLDREGRASQFSTGSFIGSSIYINLDTLFIIENGIVRSINNIEAFELVLKILNTRYQNQIDIKELNKKLEVIFQDKYIKTSLKQYSRSDISLEVVTLNSLSVYITSESSRVKIDGLIENSLLCLNGEIGKLIKLSNIYTEGMGFLDKIKKRVEISFLAEVSYLCGLKQYIANLNILGNYLIENEAGYEINSLWYYDSKNRTNIVKENISINLYDIH